jgi:polysaccharide biosynthesis protein PslG
MSSRGRALLGGVIGFYLATVLLPALAPAATRAGSASPAPLDGVNIEGLTYGTPANQADLELAWAQRLHAKVVRLEVPWAVMEPAAREQIDPAALAFTDRLMARAGALGIKVIMLAEDTPCWASTAPSRVLRRCSQRALTPANAWPPRSAGDYGAFVAFLAQRYASGLAAIEVWNEPDQSNQHYLAGPNKAQHYAEILRAAYPAIKQAAPGVPVLAGALVGSNGAFLRALYAAGIKGYYDGLAVHFYTLTLASLRSIRQVQLENGDAKPLWLDEFGWSSCWPRSKIQQEQACVTRQIQATNLLDTVRAVARMPYVAAAVVYKLRGNASEDFGVMSAGGSLKPAFAALAAAFSSPFAAITPVTVRLRRASGSVLASGSAPPGDFMLLEALRGSVPRYRAIFTLDRFNRFSLRLPSVLGAEGLTVRVFQYGAWLARSAQRHT